MSRPKGLSLDSGRPCRAPKQDAAEGDQAIQVQGDYNSRTNRASSVGAVLSIEPISILGKNRRSSGASTSSSHGSRHSVKFCEPEWPDGDLRRFSESSSTTTSSSVASCFRYRSLDMPSQASIPESPDETETDLPYSPEKFSLNEFLTIGSSNSSISTSIELTTSKSSSTSNSSSVNSSESHHQPSVKPKCRLITRPPDRNSMIASFELKVPNLITPGSNISGTDRGILAPVSPGGTFRHSPMLGVPRPRGLTILSPHNPPPELHFGSSITLRTRKGKTIVLPKLRMPMLLPDPSFLG